MAKPFAFIAVAAFSVALTSCFKDEAPNQECDIEQAYLHAAVPTEMFLQPSDSLVNVPSVDANVTISVKEGTDLTQLAPQFRLTPGATIEPANGSVHDFSKTGEKDDRGNDIYKTVQYTVTSEDGAYHRTYNVSVRYYPLTINDYNFEHYFLEPTTQKYYVWSDLDESNPNWATGNAGFSIARGSAGPDEYPTTPYANGVEGYGVKLCTSDTGPFGKIVNMRIAAGNLFLGVFDSKTATMKPLQATHFGEGAANKISKRPLSFTGYYQYTPGTTFTDKDGNVVEGRVDQGDIYAVVFKNTKENGDAFYLTGDNVLTSPQIVALARVPNVTRTEDGWCYFNVPFSGDLGFDHIADYDPQLLANGGYNIAVVFTSSIEGASFEGAVGSTLLIDKVSVVYEK